MYLTLCLLLLYLNNNTKTIESVSKPWKTEMLLANVKPKVRGHMTGEIRSRLYWLDMPSRDQFKLCCLAFPCLQCSVE